MRSFVTLAALALPAQDQDPAPPPNLVLIFCDDLGYGDVGCYGAADIATPNLDRLGRDGMRFSSYYAAQAVCSASRAALLTGCYPNRVGIHGALGPNAKTGIAEREQTLAELLRARGYATGIFGKWHLGHEEQFLPMRHGFDEWFGLPYSNDMWPVDFDGKPVEQGRKSDYPPLPLHDGDEVVQTIATLADQDMLTTRYTERAVAFLERVHERPFFLYVPHSMPHVPLGVSARMRGKSKRGIYGDVVQEIDWSAGEILAALERLGVAGNTLVLFTSDNGPWLNFGNHAGSSGGLREGKGTAFEGGVRVPCIARWPGHVPAGAVCDELMTTMDVLPTFVALAGAKQPELPIDGIDLSALLLGKPGARGREEFWYYYPEGSGPLLQAVRAGNWKLHVPHPHRSYVGVEPGRGGHPGAYAKGEIGLSLFDLARDPGEREDVSADHPDVVAELQKVVARARADLGDAGKPGPGVRPAGRVQR